MYVFIFSMAFVKGDMCYYNFDETNQTDFGDSLNFRFCYEHVNRSYISRGELARFKVILASVWLVRAYIGQTIIYIGSDQI